MRGVERLLTVGEELAAFFDLVSEDLLREVREARVEILHLEAAGVLAGS